jgi:hypothetical protein
VFFSQDALWTGLLKRRFKRRYLSSDARRFRRAFFRELSESELGRVQTARMETLMGNYNRQPVADEEAYRRLMARMGEAIGAIQARGGRVALIRYPSRGEHLRVEQDKYPRDRYWDRLAGELNVTTVYWEDIETLRGYNCPDYSHLDYRDAIAFTEALAHHLVGLGVLD